MPWKAGTMFTKIFSGSAAASLLGLGLAAYCPLAACAQDAPGKLQEMPAGVRLTLEEAEQQALAKNKLLNLAVLNIEAKAYAIKAARADYFPKVSANALYFHFNDDLGTVLSAGGRTLSGMPACRYHGLAACGCIGFIRELRTWQAKKRHAGPLWKVQNHPTRPTTVAVLFD